MAMTRAEISKKYRERHPDRAKANKKKYRESEKGKATEKAYSKKYNMSEKAKENQKRYRETHREKINTNKRKNWSGYYQRHKQSILERNKKYRKRDKKILVHHYSNGTMKCALCPCEDIDVLTIDHVDGGGNKMRKKMKSISGITHFYTFLIKKKFPDGYRVLCFNCNHKEALRLGYRGKHNQVPDEVVKQYLK